MVQKNFKQKQQNYRYLCLYNKYQEDEAKGIHNYKLNVKYDFAYIKTNFPCIVENNKKLINYNLSLWDS